MHQRPPVVVAARRTPITAAGRALAGCDVPALAAPVLAALAADLRAAGVDHPVDDVVLGNCCGPGGDVARISALAAGLGTDVPGVSVDRQCGSGLEAIRLAAALVASGQADVVLAGGAESATTARDGGARARFTPAGFPDPQMGAAADDVARLRGVGRERQDAYAARSHSRAVAARDAGAFAAELVEVAGTRLDDRPRAGLSVQRLARFRPVFGSTGTVTAGNACGINDGAAAVAVVSDRVRARSGLTGLAVLGSAVAGVDPAHPGLGPVPAVRAGLARVGAGWPDVGLLEITEAFAAVVLACTDDWGLDPLGADDARVCPQGGAIALGHPWGASGALLVVRLFASMVGRVPAVPGELGVATCAVGGGQGVALVVRRVG